MPEWKVVWTGIQQHGFITVAGMLVVGFIGWIFKVGLKNPVENHVRLQERMETQAQEQREAFQTQLDSQRIAFDLQMQQMKLIISESENMRAAMRADIEYKEQLIARLRKTIGNHEARIRELEEELRGLLDGADQ